MPKPRLHRGPLSRALILESPDPVLDEGLREAGIEPIRIDTTPDQAGMVALCQEHRPHLLFKRSRLEVNAEILDAAPELFAVMLCCIGDDSVDKQACADRGVIVLNDPRSNGRSVAELVIGILLMGARRIPEAWAATREHVWTKSASGRFEVKGKTLGILGLGNIGKQVARLAEGLGMDILFHDSDEVALAVGETMEWEAVETFEELFRRSDVISVHLSAEDARGRANRGAVTREQLHMFGSERPAESPRVFVNLARGFVVEPADLIAAVESGAVRHAFVDVFPEEPQAGQKDWENPFAGHPQIHGTPHIGAATRDAQPRIGRKMVRTARQFSLRGTVEDCVFMPRRRIDVARTAMSPHVLVVVHSDARGTKKAVDDAIYRAGVNNLQSIHQDFPRYGIAYELSVLERPLTDDELENLIERARSLTGGPNPIRAVRQLTLS
ncbi:MAG: 3-phosphoglycerate dehydrogenase [Proteobacteria bacterium]|nr:3-phosphoglycerate dehydrogenase [Pseudomonadota bacterium]